MSPAYTATKFSLPVTATSSRNITRLTCHQPAKYIPGFHTPGNPPSHSSPPGKRFPSGNPISSILYHLSSSISNLLSSSYYLLPFILGLFLTFIPGTTVAAWLTNQQTSVRQPDGSVIQCFASGDEFHQWLHDDQGYTLVQGEDGYYYYGMECEGQVLPGPFRAGNVDPAGMGIKPWARISAEEYARLKQGIQTRKGARNPVSGQINNLVIFIRFSDDTEFTTPRSTFEQKFNPEQQASLHSYYNEVSYSKLDITSTTYPACAPQANLSYQDSHPRSYFQPYHAVSNPGGYTSTQDRTLREHALLRDAVNWINIASPVPAGLDLDTDNDGFVDNICFMVRGSNGGWSSLLWAHSWTLFSFDVFINGSEVLNYTFHPETQSSVPTLCHELFHTFGAPDLYHYENSSLQPVQSWDLMDSGSGHMGAYMKWMYTSQEWIEDIPEITSSGYYTLNPLSSAQGNCYKIRTPYSNSQYFVLEYRRKTGLFESNVPGSGLLVYRIDPVFYGNSEGPPDEVYIFRINGSVTQNGDPAQAFLSGESGRTFLSDSTNPACFLQNGTPGGIIISGVTQTGDAIGFNVLVSSTGPASALSAAAEGMQSINLHWTPNTSLDQVLLACSNEPVFGNPMMGKWYEPGDILPGGGQVIFRGNAGTFQHADLMPNTLYYYSLWSVDEGGFYSSPVTTQCYTECGSVGFPFLEAFDGAGIPNCFEIQQSFMDDDLWQIKNSNYAGGTGRELVCMMSGHTGHSRLVFTPMQTIGITKLGMSFRLNILQQFQGATLRVQTSSDLINWHNSGWAISTSPGSSTGPVTIELELDQDLDSPLTYIAFTVEGNLWAFSFIYFDDLEISILESDFYQIETLALPMEGGTTAGGGYFYPGQLVTVHAYPSPGYNFTGWKEGSSLVAMLPEYTFIAGADRSLAATFSTTLVNIVAGIDPPGAGTTLGGGIYHRMVPVELDVEPSPGYQFSAWSENGQVVSSTASYSFSASVNRYLTALMVPRLMQVRLSASPQAGGTVSGEGDFQVNSQVSVHAEAREGYLFTGWYENGILISSMASYTFEISADHLLEAVFYCPACELSLLASPPEGGTVSGEGYFPSGNLVTVNAEPSQGWVFDDWTEEGALLSPNKDFSFVINSNRLLQANFLKVHTVQTSVLPLLSGIVVGDGNYVDGLEVTLAAFPNEDFEFCCWTDGPDTLAFEPMIQFIASSDRNLVAHFRKPIGLDPVVDNLYYLSPQPCKEFLDIRLSPAAAMEQLTYNIESMEGRTVVSGSAPVEAGRARILVSALPPGMYVLRFSTDKQRWSSARFIILK